MSFKTEKRNMRKKALTAPGEKTFEEKLIEAIQKNECLFHKDSIYYRKNNIKQKAWTLVAAETGRNAKECQHRWRSLRDRFVRETKAKSNCKWRYMKKLLFLKPHLEERKQVILTVCRTYPICRARRNNEEPISCSCSHSDDSEASHSVHEFEAEKPSVSESIIHVPLVPVKEDEELKEDDEIKEEVIFVPGSPTPCNSPEPISERLESGEKSDRLDKAIDNSITGGDKVNAETGINSEKSRNEDYYKTLDSYMMRLPPIIQDDLKIEILNRVYNELKKHCS